MYPATERRPAGPLSALLAGLQAGMLGVFCMLAWLGVSAEWQRRSFWTAENLMASVFYGPASVRAGFASRTLSGLAVYLLIYSGLGALFVLLVRDRVPPTRAILLSVVVSLTWYYLAFRWLFHSILPLVALLHAERPTVIGHLVYGIVLGRYPVYLHRATKPAEPPATAPDPSMPATGPEQP